MYIPSRIKLTIELVLLLSFLVYKVRLIYLTVKEITKFMCRLAILACMVATKKYLVNFANFYLVGTVQKLNTGNQVLFPEMDNSFYRNTTIPLNLLF